MHCLLFFLFLFLFLLLLLLPHLLLLLMKAPPHRMCIGPQTAEHSCWRTPQS